MCQDKEPLKVDSSFIQVSSKTPTDTATTSLDTIVMRRKPPVHDMFKT